MPFFWLIFEITRGKTERFSRFREIFSARLQERGGEKERRGEKIPHDRERKQEGEPPPTREGKIEEKREKERKR